MRHILRIASITTLLAAAACAHASAAKTAGATRPCTPSVQPPAMLYPMTGAKDVPAGNFTLVLAFSYGTNLELTAAGSTVPVAGVKVNAPVPDPLPSPAATPQPGITPYGYAIPALAAHTTYTVAAHFMPVDPGCTASTVTIGTFTTK